MNHLLFAVALFGRFIIAIFRPFGAALMIVPLILLYCLVEMDKYVRDEWKAWNATKGGAK